MSDLGIKIYLSEQDVLLLRGGERALTANGMHPPTPFAALLKRIADQAEREHESWRERAGK